jgi:hypothetical protein
MIKIVTRNTNKNSYCCNKSYKINKIDLLINNQDNYKSFDYYSDTACDNCGDNHLKFFIIKKKNNGDME